MATRSRKVSNRHWGLKEKARALRARGYSYKEILVQVPVSKSTISLWCRDVPLSREQRKQLSERWDTQLLGIKAIQKMFWKKRCDAFFQGVRRYARRSTVQERFIAGLMLYWAEGNKGSHSTAIANSDPRVIQFMVEWFREFFGISSSELTVHLHLHSGQNERHMQLYWSELTGISLQNFRKSFIKPEGSGYRKNILYHGTVKLTVRRPGSTYLLFTILGCISSFLKQSIGEEIKPEAWMPKLPFA